MADEYNFEHCSADVHYACRACIIYGLNSVLDYDRLMAYDKWYDAKTNGEWRRYVELCHDGQRALAKRNKESMAKMSAALDAVLPPWPEGTFF